MDKSDIRVLVKQMGRRPVSFNPAYAEIGGSVAAGLMIAQAIHWSAYEDEDGFFFRTMDNWTLDTALSHDEQRSARRKLRAIEHEGSPLWEEKRKGLPAQIYYRINIDVLAELLVINNSNIKTLEKSNTGHRDSRTPDFDNSEHLNNSDEMTNEMTNENGKSDSSESQPEAVSENPDDTLAGLDGLVGKRTRGKKSPPPPAPAPRNDRRVWGMVDSYFSARGIKGHMVSVRERNQVYNIFDGLHPSVGFRDIEGCTRYLGSDQWYQEPGRLTADAVAKAVLDWIQKGRPDIVVPKRQGGSSGFAAAMGRFAEFAKEQGQ